MDREVAIELLKQEKGVLVQVINTGYMIGIGKEYTDKGRATIEAIDLAIEALQKVSVYEQVKWERDRALETLDEHGIGLGQIAEETSTTTDCISRQQAVEAVANIIWHFLALATDALAGLPPVTPTERTREWIPVSEKNPSQTGEYLVTAVCDNGSTFTDKFGYTPTTDGGWYDPEVPSQTHTDWNEHIIAWQPMPTPYKGGDTE